MNNITNDIFYIGVNDHQLDLFEGQYDVPNGMAYNSYIIKDEKIAVLDTVDGNFTDEWLGNIRKFLGDKQPDLLIVQHMEPDHSATLALVLDKYSEAKIIVNAKTLQFISQFFPGISSSQSSTMTPTSFVPSVLTIRMVMH